MEYLFLQLAVLFALATLIFWLLGSSIAGFLWILAFWMLIIFISELFPNIFSNL